MTTLLEFSNAVVKIRSAVNELEVKGERNATLIVYTTKMCDDILQAIAKAVKAAPDGVIEIVEKNDPPPDTNGVDAQ